MEAQRYCAENRARIARPVQVDVVRLQPLERRVARAADLRVGEVALGLGAVGFAGQGTLARLRALCAVAARARAGDLGGDEERGAQRRVRGGARRQPAADDLLRRAAPLGLARHRVHLGDVEEVAAERDVAIENCVGGGLVRHRAKGHRAEANLADLAAGRAELDEVGAVGHGDGGEASAWARRARGGRDGHSSRRGRVGSPRTLAQKTVSTYERLVTRARRSRASRPPSPRRRRTPRGVAAPPAGRSTRAPSAAASPSRSAPPGRGRRGGG